MWEQIYFWDESLTEDDYRKVLLYLAGDAFPDLSEEELATVVEEAFFQIPEQYAEGVLSTIANVGRAIGNAGKDIGSDALKYISDNPDLINIASGAVGTVIGGPIGGAIGGAIGSKLSGYVGQRTQNQNPPEIKKDMAAAASAVTNPQVQTAIARGALGIGNGVTPVVQNNGMINQVPTATFLRGLIQLLQKALVELDASGSTPNSTIVESSPFAEDPDRQAEWLMEELIG